MNDSPNQLLRILEKTDKSGANNDRLRLYADIEVFAKAVEWILRHDEFYAEDYLQQAHSALHAGLARLNELGEPFEIPADQRVLPWDQLAGKQVRGYKSKVDGSIQPYALSLPDAVNDSRSDSTKAVQRWPLHVVLHGRAAKMNEVNFIHRHHRKKTESQAWIQLDVFGRTNNAYRWAGETDVFEAIDDVKRRFNIDEERITLRGFSMGGAGAWHLGLHYADIWSSVGPGAGFVDFYKYQNQSELRPAYQHAALGIYDAVDYALNAANVPICTYGGEKDKQLAASTTMVAAAEKHGIDIKLIVGPNMGHKFDPESRRAFLAFHVDKSKEGRASSPRKQIRFTTRSLRHNRCDWIEVVEVSQIYEPAIVEASYQEKAISISTKNVAVLKVDLKTEGQLTINGQLLEKPENRVYLSQGVNGWQIHNSLESITANNRSALRKRKGLSGPIDDAFFDSFVCVRGTGKPWSQSHQAWTEWKLSRFEAEFDKWMRGRLQILNDTDVTDQIIQENHLVLFGDPGSNSVLARVHKQLPIHWTAEAIEVNGQSHSTSNRSLSMIYPNPLSSSRYIVINSGHTIHERDFTASNAWLFPRLGDIAIQGFSATPSGDYSEETIWAELFSASWSLPKKIE